MIRLDGLEYDTGEGSGIWIPYLLMYHDNFQAQLETLKLGDGCLLKSFDLSCMVLRRRPPLGGYGRG